MEAADDTAWLEDAKRVASEEHWIPLSDLMTGLMMIFMLISVISLAAMERSRNAMRQVAHEYSVSRHAMYLELQREFAPDLRRWRARIEPDLSVKFEQQEVLFATGQAALREDFRRTLSDFFPVMSESWRINASPIMWRKFGSRGTRARFGTGR